MIHPAPHLVAKQLAERVHPHFSLDMKPLAVWDVHDDGWRHHWREKSEWARAHGVPVNETYRLEFHLLDAPFAKVFTYHLDDAGQRHWTHGHNPQTCGPDHACGACKKLPA